MLNWIVGGILINDVPYNVFCYADDLILTSTCMTWLQTLINSANNYIDSHGLQFNPTKTLCHIWTKSPTTRWFLGGCKLAETDRIGYPGAVISDNPFHHAESRISARRRAFYALQRVALCKRGTNPDTIRYLWMTVLRPVLIYGISCMNMPQKAIESLEKCQTKLFLYTITGTIWYEQHYWPNNGTL